MDMTEEQLFDFINCPVLYDIKRNKQLPLEESVGFQDIMRKVSRFFYLKLSLGEVPTLAELKRKLDIAFKPYEGIIDEKILIKAMQYLSRLYDWAETKKLVVVDMDSPYAITADAHKLEGVMGVIIAGQNGRDELLITNFSERLPQEDLNTLKLKYTIDAYAYRLKYGKDLGGIRIHSVKYNKDLLTYRKNTDYERLFSTIKSVGASIEQDLYYTRDYFGCATCPARNLCKYWYTE